jgi:hypothetical protein
MMAYIAFGFCTLGALLDCASAVLAAGEQARIASTQTIPAGKQRVFMVFLLKGGSVFNDEALGPVFAFQHAAEVELCDCSTVRL